MAQLETFNPRSFGVDFSPLLRIKQALDQNKNRDFAERQQALKEEILRGNLGVAEAELLLKEEAGDLAGRKFESETANQQNLQDTLSQLINPTQPQAQQPVPGQVSEGVAPAPVRPAPRPEPDIAKREEFLLELSGMKGGPAIVKAIEPIFASRDLRAKQAFERDIKEKQRFGLSLTRMKDRAAQDRAIDNRIKRLSRKNEDVSDLVALRNMNDADREQELFLDTAHGGVLQKIAENELVPAKPAKPLDKFVDVKNKKGEVIAQKNVTTGKVIKSPLAKTVTEEKAGIHNLPDGSKVTTNQLLSQYRLQNDLIDDLDLKILSKTDPERAAIERDKIRNALPFDQWAKQNFGVDVRGGFQPEEEIEASPVALPKTKAGLVKGRIYQTGRGPATWNGKMFEPVEK